MADEPIITLDVEKFRTKKQQKLLAMLNDDKVKTHINTYIKDAINEFVPLKSGALRRSGKAHPNSITWGGDGVPYARYQYYGEIYGPNIPGAIHGSPAWKSGSPKHPTGRMIGDFKGTLMLRPKWQVGEPVEGLLPYKFGYTTPKTHHHWDKYFRYLPKLKTNIEITRYLKRECKKRGLKT